MLEKVNVAHHIEFKTRQTKSKTQKDEKLVFKRIDRKCRLI